MVENWTKIIDESDLPASGRQVIKINGKQLLIWKTEKSVYICNNRCPHEGYPLAEGTITDGCILTCNWHNWKFNLESGKTIIGGDSLTTYPVRIEDGAIIADLADPPPERLRESAIHGLEQAFKEHDTARINREIARYERHGGNATDLIQSALNWASDELEFGTTHAHAAAADWLALRDEVNVTNQVDRMVPVAEIIGHLSWDSLTNVGTFPFLSQSCNEYCETQFEVAIENEDEASAMAHLNAALSSGGAQTIRPALERAAMRHYQNFGHAPIYVTKAYELLEHFGEEAAAAVLKPVTRSLIKESREDLIPEFRGYAKALQPQKTTEPKPLDAADFRKKGINACLKLISESGPSDETLYDCLMMASAEAMLYFDANL